MTFLVIYAAVITLLYVVATVAYNDLAAENRRLKDAERRQQMAAHPASGRVVRGPWGGGVA